MDPSLAENAPAPCPRDHTRPPESRPSDHPDDTPFVTADMTTDGTDAVTPTRERDSLDLPPQNYRTVPIQVLVNNLPAIQDDADPSLLKSHPILQHLQSHHMSAHLADSDSPDATDAALDADEDGVWEDEEGDSDLETTLGLDQDSDLSEDELDPDSDQHKVTYREALRQYRRSRRALLLSGLSSQASSPSIDDMQSRVSRQETPDSLRPSASEQYRLSPSVSDTYLNSALAESIDAADAPGRAHDAVFNDPTLGKVLSEKNGSFSSTSRFSSSESLEQSDAYQSHTHDDSQPGSPDFMTSESPEDTYASEPSTPTLGDNKPLPSKEHEQQDSGSARDGGLRAVRQEALDSHLSDATKETQEIGLDSPQAESNPNPMHQHHQDQATVVSSLPDQVIQRRASRAEVHLRRPSVTKLRRDTNDQVSSIQANGQAETTERTNGVTPVQQDSKPPFSLWDYLQEEVLATDFDSTQEMKWERVTNFMAIPFWMEKIIMFGFAVCLDSFLYTFTILPLRFGVAFWTWITNTVTWMLGGERRYLHSSHKCDILKCLLIVLSSYILAQITDASKMYHSVRGQDVVKLSVIFNVLEIADRLCCSFGQDLLDSLFSRNTLARRKNGRQPYLRPLGFFLLGLAYILAHTLVLFYQLVTLNVAINSYDNALLTLLLSNQFVEIKSSVFKKFEKENVFQMTCADIVERFQLTLMLSAIGLRNLFELSGGAAEGAISPLPTSFTVFPSLSLLETILTPLCIVLASECVVDWLKHAFITKFNHIRPAVYGRFMDVLCRDLVVGGPSQRSRKHSFVDQSPIVSRRLGFAALPLACLLIRLIGQILGMIGDTSHFDECTMPDPSLNPGLVGTAARKLGAVDINSATIRTLDLFVRGSAWALTLVIAWAFLVAMKLLLGANLVSFASYRYASMQERELEESLNNRDRAPIGVDKDEQSYDRKLAQLLDKNEDDAIQVSLDGKQITAKPKKESSGHKEKKPDSLMEVSRYTMVRSRIW